MIYHLQRPEKMLSPVLEQKYRASRWQRDCKAGLISLLVCSVLLVSGFWGDLLVINYYHLGIFNASVPAVFIILGLRVLATLLTLVLGLWIFKYRHHSQFVTSDFLFFSWLLLNVVLIILSETTRPVLYHSGAVIHVVCVMTMYLVIPQHNLYFRILPPVLFTVGYIGIYTSIKQPPVFFGFLSLYVGFIIVNVVSFIFSHITHTIDRRRFALNLEKDQLIILLAQGTEALEQKNQELVREKEMVAAYETELRKREVQREKMRTLQAQIKPHFLYNTLSTIAYYCRTQPDQAYKLIGDLSIYLQGAFKVQCEQIPVENELDIVRAYLAIEMARMEDRLKIEMEVAGDFSGCRLPPFTLQPLVGNAVRHGLSPLPTGGTLKVIAREEANCYYYAVVDNGVGISAEKQAELLSPCQKGSDSGLGLANVHQRLVGLCGSGLEIVSELGSGTTVCFSIAKIQET